MHFNYLFFHIIIKEKDFYYNNSKSFSELLILLISLIIISLSTYSLITIPNIPIYLIISFAFQCFILLIFIGLTIYYLIISRDYLISYIKSYFQKKDKLKTYIKRSNLVRWGENGTIDNNNNNYITNLHKSVDKEVLKLFAITTTTVIKQDILITICRNMTHMVLILLTMLTGFIFYLDTQLIKVFVVILSCILIYNFCYYYYLLIHAFCVFHKSYNKKIWIPFIIFLGLLIMLLVSYISIAFVYNLLDSMNANHSTFIIVISSIYLIFLMTIMPTYIILNSVQKWKTIIEKRQDMDS